MSASSPFESEVVSVGHQRQRERVAGLAERLKSEGAVAAGLPPARAVARIGRLVRAAWNEVAAGRNAAADARAPAARTLLQGSGGRHER